MNKTIDAQVLCPYYLREKENTIGCEGVINGTDTVTKFRTKNEKSGFMRKHCLDLCGGGCELAEYFNGKYGV